MKSVDEIKDEMMQKKTWALVGVTEDKTKFGYKIFKKLMEKGYTVYGVNPKYEEIEGQKIYKSISDLPEKVECINVVVSPKISMNVLDEIIKNNINYVWFQPGAFDEEVLNKAKGSGLEVVYFDCLYVELGKV